VPLGEEATRDNHVLTQDSNPTVPLIKSTGNGQTQTSCHRPFNGINLFFLYILWRARVSFAYVAHFLFLQQADAQPI
jgi:hypothetical protein